MKLVTCNIQFGSGLFINTQLQLGVGESPLGSGLFINTQLQLGVGESPLAAFH